jgi:hypothetical protein
VFLCPPVSYTGSCWSTLTVGVVCVSLSSEQLHWLLLVNFDSGCGVCFSVLLSVTLAPAGRL